MNPPVSERPRFTILVVDDNPANLAALVDYLEGQGNRVLVAQDGEEGLGRARFAAPDLILLDVRMPPGIDGLETCRRLKAEPRTRDIPVIFMTAMGATSDTLAGLEAGAVDYVTKPFCLAEVAVRIEIHLSLRALQQQLLAQNRQLEKEVAERREAQAALQRHHDDLEGLVAQRTAELRAARDQAEAVNRGKSVFLSNMSHELRNPLQVVLTFADLGRRLIAEPAGEGLAADKLRHYFDGIHSSGERLLELLNNLLDLARLEAGKMPMNWQAVSPAELLREVEVEFRPQLAEKAVTLRVVAPEQPARATMDGQRIVQVLRKLLDNALRCSPRDGAIVLSLSGGSLPGGPAAPVVAALRLGVADQGGGIPEDELDGVFEIFGQGRGGRAAAGGIRLGLAICRHIVAAHHGRIQARNRPEGGCEFEVLLPLVPPESAEGAGEG
jgi:signal transduction histidine kinase